MKRRLLNILIALDQLVYVLLTLGHGSPDETLSATTNANLRPTRCCRIFVK